MTFESYQSHFYFSIQTNNSNTNRRIQTIAEKEKRLLVSVAINRKRTTFMRH